MSKRYATFIRRIVGFDPTKSALDAAAQKDSIAGRRGIGYMSTDGTTALSQKGTSGTSGTTLPYIPTASLASGAAIGNLASNYIVDPRSPLNSIRESGSGNYDMKDMLDGIRAPHIDDLPGTGLGGFNLGSGGSLNELTGLTDCDTGQGIKFVFDDTLEPPPGWTDADTPPDGYEWEMGFNYHDTNPNTNVVGIALGATLAEALQNQAGWVSVIGATIGTFVQMYIGNDPAFPAATWVAGYADYTHSAGSPPNALIRVYVHTKSSCTVPSTFCGTVGPDSSYHPVDGEMSLRLIDGKFVHHALEAPADVIPAYTSDEQSTIHFCFDGGTRNGTITPAVNGGYMIYETDGPEGAPLGPVRVFSSDNRMTAVTDITGISAYIPQAP